MESDIAVGDNDPFSGDINFGVFVNESGGKYFFNRNDVDMEMKRWLQLGSEYYTLTHTISTPSNPMEQVGESIAFASSRIGFKDEGVYTDAPQPYGELLVMRYDGTHIEQIADNQVEEGTPAWQPIGVGQGALQR